MSRDKSGHLVLLHQAPPFRSGSPSAAHMGLEVAHGVAKRAAAEEAARLPVDVARPGAHGH